MEALARALLSVLLALLDARIARNQARLFQGRPQIAVVFDQCSRDAVTNRAGLPLRAAARYVDHYVELIRRLSQLQRLANDHPQRFVRKIRFEGLAINLEVTAARPQINASSRRLSPPGPIILNLCHVLILLVFLFLIFA